jgi:hypothetical protein
MTRPQVRYLGPLTLWLAVAVAISLIEGAPYRLPSIALGSTVLLHALRAGALFAIGFAIATVLTRAGAGRLPTVLGTSGISYAAEETRVTKATLVELQREVDTQRAALDRLAKRFDAGRSKG